MDDNKNWWNYWSSVHNTIFYCLHTGFDWISGSGFPLLICCVKGFFQDFRSSRTTFHVILKDVTVWVLQRWLAGKEESHFGALRPRDASRVYLRVIRAWQCDFPEFFCRVLASLAIWLGFASHCCISLRIIMFLFMLSSLLSSSALIFSKFSPSSGHGVCPTFRDCSACGSKAGGEENLLKEANHPLPYILIQYASAPQKLFRGRKSRATSWKGHATWGRKLQVGTGHFREKCDLRSRSRR
jgi:hypothetical protein